MTLGRQISWLFGRIKTNSVACRLVELFLGTGILLVFLSTVLGSPTASAFPDPPKNVLSYYLMDTAFLQKCVERHSRALEINGLVSPEIQLAALALSRQQGR